MLMCVGLVRALRDEPKITPYGEVMAVVTALTEENPELLGRDAEDVDEAEGDNGQDRAADEEPATASTSA
jgi:hypothetical protein